MRALPASIVAALCALTQVGHAAPGDDDATDAAVFAGVTGATEANVRANPAALLNLLPGVHLYAISTGSLEQIAIARRQIDPDTGEISSAGTVTDRVMGAGLTLGVAWRRPALLVAIQAALHPPTETIDDPAVAYHTRGSRSRRIDVVSAAVGLRPLRWLYVGVSGTAAYYQRVLRYAHDTALEAGTDPTRGIDSDCGGAPCGYDNPVARELWTIEVEPSSLVEASSTSITLAVMAELPRGLLIAVAAEDLFSLTQTGVGTATIVSAPRDGGAVVRGEAVIRQRPPQVVRIGGRGALRYHLDAVAELRWRRLARAEPLDVRIHGIDVAAHGVAELEPWARGIDDAVAFEIGVEQTERGRPWRLGARLGYDTGATAPARLSARAPWARQLTAAVGAQFRYQRWTVQLGYRLDVQLATSTGVGAFDPRDRVSCVDAGYDYDLPACATVRAGYGMASAIGDYQRLTHHARLALAVGF